MAPGTRFCAGCGAPAVDPEMTRFAGTQPPPPPPHQPFAAPPIQPTPSAYNAVAARRERGTDDERQIFQARPTLLFVKIGYGLAALGAILLIIILASVSAPWWVALPLALALLLIPAFYHIKRNTLLYTLTNHKLEIDEGFIARTTRNLPLRNIQDVTVSASVTQRLLGYGNIVIDNASELGGSTVMHNIHNPRHYADMLLRELRRYH
jgi:membrane protein YdbS with pleckstrin-like domain